MNIPKEFDSRKIQIGIPVSGDEAKRVCLYEQGDMVLPLGNFGAQSRKNAYGYTYADKTKPKECRYVSINWVYPFGNISIADLDLLTIGLVNDMFTERQNDDCPYKELASQADNLTNFDRIKLD